MSTKSLIKPKLDFPKGEARALEKSGERMKWFNRQRKSQKSSSESKLLKSYDIKSKDKESTNLKSRLARPTQTSKPKIEAYIKPTQSSAQMTKQGQQSPLSKIH